MRTGGTRGNFFPCFPAFPAPHAQITSAILCAIASIATNPSELLSLITYTLHRLLVVIAGDRGLTTPKGDFFHSFFSSPLSLNNTYRIRLNTSFHKLTV